MYDLLTYYLIKGLLYWESKYSPLLVKMTSKDTLIIYNNKMRRSIIMKN